MTATAARGSDYAALIKTVRDAGLLERRLPSYAIRGLLTLGLYAATCLAVVWVGDSWYQLINAAVFGLAWGQIAFLGHDAGHQAIFTSRRSNDALGRTLGNFLVGLSYGWWVDTHNRHHANPNHEDRDPDIGDGVLAFTAAQAARRTGAVSRFIARRQAWLFFPLLTLEGISLHVDSAVAVQTGKFRSARGGSRRYEAIGLILHAMLYVTFLLLVMSPEKAVAFAAVHQAVWGVYMGCTFAPNHKGMAIIARGDTLDFLRRQVLTSRNVRGGLITDFALGGLNYQIEHHLFPNMPRASLRHAQPLVRAHCEALGLPYCETSLLGSYRVALTHLNAMGAPLRAESTAAKPAIAGL
ncbi:acyl-CoA desaturase [Jatrophihabitans cynanchi]|uniref:Acyl-CoA desaturase n=1 Tax=Jatrophihabitans cynanchi TaxID=2944128 RepID=A0ABY7JTT3_9ACTN|nr:acyl-CoA desaturase [Jatrophihabitans sp. SB3-54]WAX55095.1 acyl-CoA desaturase [Jatrophihabitans sp. SB3-54]